MQVKTSSERLFCLPRVAQLVRALAIGYQLKPVTTAMYIIPAPEAPDWFPPPSIFLHLFLSPYLEAISFVQETFFFCVSLSLSPKWPAPKGFRAPEKQTLICVYILTVCSLDTVSLGRGESPDLTKWGRQREQEIHRG